MTMIPRAFTQEAQIKLGEKSRELDKICLEKVKPILKEIHELEKKKNKLIREHNRKFKRFVNRIISRGIT